MTPLQASLTVTVAILAYTWLGYPLLLALFARMRGGPCAGHPAPTPKPDQDKTNVIVASALSETKWSGSRSRPGVVSDEAGSRPTLPPSSAPVATQSPHLHIIIAAFNEEDVIAARIGNLQAADYPAPRLHVYLGTDGCTDRTAEVACGAIGADPRFALHVHASNRGKVAVLRDLVALAREELRVDPGPHLFVFTDANTAFAQDALTRLAAHFGDPAIGAVCGRLVFRPAGAGNSGSEESSYWQFETRLKTWESVLDSCLGANGAIYAVRPTLFWDAIPTNTIVDDLVIGMKVRAAGRRVVYDAAAVGVEELPAIRSEWGRRVRIGAGDYQALWLCRECLLPHYGWFAWSFLSHKVLRWFTPHLLLLLVGMAAVHARHATPASPLAAAILAAAAAALAAAGVGRLWQRLAPQPPVTRLLAGGYALLRLTDHFLTMQAALLVGFARFCRGNLGGAWRRTPRSS